MRIQNDQHHRCRFTKMALGSASIHASRGVRQGAPTSGFLFTLLVNDLIRSLKAECNQPDDYLGSLHSLMMMDDTILLASSRASALKKIRILNEFCSDSGMQVNDTKTLFMVINGSEEDRSPLMSDNIRINNCHSYTLPWLRVHPRWKHSGSDKEPLPKQVGACNKI